MTPPISERDAAVLAVVLASGTHGLSRAEIAARLNRDDGGAILALRRLRRRSLIEPSHCSGGQSLRWGAPGTRAAYEAVQSASERYRKERAAQREAAREAQREAAGEPTTWRQPRRYASVWDWAGRACE